MDRKTRIYEYMKSKEYHPLQINELAAVLCVPSQDMSEFTAVLDELTAEGKIFLTKKNRYEVIDGVSIIAGILRCSATGYFGFVIPDSDNEDIHINGDKLSGALDGDRVLAVIDGSAPHSGRREGHIKSVLERGNHVLTGVVSLMPDGSLSLKPDNGRIFAQIKIRPDGLTATDGERVCSEIVEYFADGSISVSITKNLGDSDDLKGYIEAIIIANNIEQEFDPQVLREADVAPATLSEEDISNRLDLRNKLIITIDGDDARDFDDAVSLEILENGNYSLGVHIADVTHYVRPKTALDSTAFLRGTSTYLADRVIPMLPKRLSNGICSLNPNEDRLTLSVIMEIDKSGNVVSHTLRECVIRSAERMTYSNVACLLDLPDPELKKRYKYLIPTLKKMSRLASILHKAREKRGSIDFDFPESHIIVGENGEPEGIVRVERLVSHRIIEEFMLTANETVAEYAFWSELPFIYRVHEPPAFEKIDEFNKFIMNFGLGIKGRFDEQTPVKPKALQSVLKKIEGTEDESMIATYMLRSLMKAEYNTQSLGHFGLAAQYYCHFTSPIRRYPDLAIHRILKDFINGKTDLSGYELFVKKAAAHSSETERTAELCERDVADLFKAAYMSEFIGECFEARISGITSFGIFAELENSVEGLIRLDTMRDDFYVFDEHRRIITGERTKKEYRIGDTISIVVARCDLLMRQIDFLTENDATQRNISAVHRKRAQMHLDREKLINQKKNTKRNFHYKNKIKKRKKTK